MEAGTRRARTRPQLLRAMLIVLAAATGCMRDPLDPRGALDHRAVGEIAQAEQRARGQLAYERARRRVGSVVPGMSIPEVEEVMEALVVVERQGDDEDEGRLPRKKLVEGFLCAVTPSPLRQRWLFGYDEDNVELFGFAVEFEREDPEDDDWRVRRVDGEPADACPEDEVSD